MNCSISRDQVRQIDEQAVHLCGMSIETLMENAGRGCAETLLEVRRVSEGSPRSRVGLPTSGASGRVVIVCGKGNNAGDGFVMARHLDLARIDVTVAQSAPATELAGAAALNFQLLSHTHVRVAPIWQSFGDGDMFGRELAGAEWVVDAVFGVGLSRPPKPPFDRLIEAMNAASGKKLAIDLPSGLDCDTGEPYPPTFRADHTCTFVAEKPGFAAASARPFLGQVHILDIGAPRRLVESVFSSNF